MAMNPSPSTSQFKERLERTLDRIHAAARASGRSPESVRLVAVSKLHPAESVAALARLGQGDFGENYIQEALAKQEVLARHPLRWHFIGRLQSNKAGQAAGRFNLIHTVDSLKLARSLQKAAGKIGRPQPVLIQVNVGREEQKAGIPEEGLTELAEAVAAMEFLSLEGLMCMPPFFGEPERARPYFARLRELREELQHVLGRSLAHLSMGMSGDYVQAIEEGATLVRVGTELFGPRPDKR